MVAHSVIFLSLLQFFFFVFQPKYLEAGHLISVVWGTNVIFLNMNKIIDSFLFLLLINSFSDPESS